MSRFISSVKRWSKMAMAGKQQPLEDISSQSSSQYLSLVDLPEEVLRHIFGFLSDADLYFNLRCMCRRLRRLVNDYVQIDTKVLLASGYQDSEKKTSEIVFLFKRGHNVTSSFSRAAAPFLTDPHLKSSLSARQRFGAVLQGKILIVQNTGVFEYKVNEDAWERLTRQYNFFSSIQLNTYVSFALQGCAINGVQLLCSGDTSQGVELLQFSDSDLENAPRSDYLSSTKSISHTPCPSPLPLKWHYHFSNHECVTNVTNIGDGKVMAVGGHVMSVHYIASKEVYQGELTENKKDVIWKQLEPMKEPRCNHITFKMKDSVYVAGGSAYSLKLGNSNFLSSCERFSLKENRWFDCQHSLPYPLSRASVSVGADESYAVITGGRSYRNIDDYDDELMVNKIVIFTEEKGFQCLGGDSSLLFARADHVSITLL